MSESTPNLLGETIHFLRTEQGISAAALSERAGYSRSYVTKVEKGDIEPSFLAVSKILNALEATDAEVLWLIRSFHDPHA